MAFALVVPNTSLRRLINRTRLLVRQIKFGVGIHGRTTPAEAVTLARTAEALGYDRFWIGDSHMIWRELYVLAGAIAMATNNESPSAQASLTRRYAI